MKGEIRKYPVDSPKNWEGDDKDEKDASLNYGIFERELRKYGVDLAKSKVLEVGTGNNTFLNYVRKQGVDIIGVDARPRGEKSKALIASRVEQLPFRNETFDVVLSAGVFDGSTYHQDQRAMLDEIRRVLKENGLFLGMINKIDIPVEKFTLVSDREALEMYKKI